MKLFYFSGSTLPSSFANAVHVMKMCAALAKAGNDVTLFAKGNQKKNIFKHYDVPSNFKLKLAPIVSVPVLSGFIRCFMTLVHAICLGRPDIVYGRDILLLAAVSLTRIPCVLELHEIPSKTIYNYLLTRVLRAQNLTALVVISDGLKQDVIGKYNFPSHQIIVAHDGADIVDGKIVPETLSPIADTVYQIGYGGSLYKGKGVELILKIAQHMPHVGFHIFGGKPEEIKIFQEEGECSNVVFYGYVSHRKLKTYLTSCDALIAPYMPHIYINTGVDIARWISPLKLFEYMALKKPILCSDLPVLREIMQDQVNCLLVDPDKIEDWSVAIERLRGDKALVRSIIENAYNAIKQKYSWDVRAVNISHSINRLLRS